MDLALHMRKYISLGCYNKALKPRSTKKPWTTRQKSGVKQLRFHIHPEQRTEFLQSYFSLQKTQLQLLDVNRQSNFSVALVQSLLSVYNFDCPV